MGLRPASRACSSTASTMASTWRSLLPVATTKTSVIASRSLTSIRTMSVASLSAAACAATRAASRASSVAVMRLESTGVGVIVRPDRSSAVEAVLADVLHDTVGHEVPDRPAIGYAGAAVTRGDGHRRYVEQGHGVERQVRVGELVT